MSQISPVLQSLGLLPWAQTEYGKEAEGRSLSPRRACVYSSDSREHSVLFEGP